MIEQLKGPPHGERHTFRRLQDKGIAASDCIRQKPERDHCREIEWRDRCHNPKRLADHHFVDAASHIFQVIALHHHRNAAGNLNVFDGAAQFSLSFRKSLAVFLGDDASQFINVLFQKLLQFE